MKIYNKRTDKDIPADAVYCGRPNTNTNEHFGNAFSRLSNSKAEVFLSQEDAVDAFRAWLLGTDFQDVAPFRRNWILGNLHLLKGKDLVCWCAPAKCHCEVLMELANQ
jgi:Domain of unknown function (DUF4326)